MNELTTLAEALGTLLKARKETIAVAESSAGGLISAALLAVPGASAYFLGGGVIYTQAARRGLLRLSDESVRGIRSSTEAYARSSRRGQSASSWAPRGGSPRRAPAGRRATVMATRPATRASPWRDRSNGPS